MKKSALRLVAFCMLGFLCIGLVPTVFAQSPDSGDSGDQQSIPGIGRYRKSSTYISPVKESPMPFTGLVMKWEQEIPAETSVDIYIKFLSGIEGEDGWSEWVELNEEFDSPDGHEQENPESLVATNLATAYQYKVVMQSENPDITPVIENLEFTYLNARAAVIDESDEKTEVLSVSLGLPITSFSGVLDGAVSSTSTVESGIRVLSRSSWGADESLRVYNEERPEGDVVETDEGYEKQFASELKLSRLVATNGGNESLTWPLEYPEKVSKIIVHHTATTKNLTDPAQAIRNIYYYHAITRGWGDIGYNYIIDPKGNVYEGRYGGEGVVGGHAARYNVGSIGIALLGNYQENEVPEAAFTSLTNLIKEKGAKHGIDPEASSIFRGELLPNVIGHRDVGATACPGTKLYALISKVKELSKGAIIATILDKRRIVADRPQFDYDLDGELPMIQLDTDSSEVVTIKLKNTGTESWNAQTNLMVSNNEAQSYLANGYLLTTNNAGRIVGPGQTATFSLPLKAASESGFANMEVFPLINGTKKLEKYISIPMQVIGAVYTYEFISLELGKDTLMRGQTTEGVLTLKNTGTVTWKRDGENRIRMGTENPRDHWSNLAEVPGTRLGNLVQEQVLPGETGEFVFKIKAPNLEGYYRESFAPVIEGVTWLDDIGMYLDIYVADYAYNSKYLGAGNMGTMIPGEKKLMWLEFTNTGRMLWNRVGNYPFRLDISETSGVGITNVDLQADTVLPGEAVKVNMLIQAPATEGLYKILAIPRIGSINLIPRPIILYIEVSKSGVSESNWVSQSTYSAISSDEIRIGLSFSGNPVVSADGTFKLFNGTNELATFNANEKVAVTYDQSKYQIKGYKSAFALSSPPVFVPSGRAILRIDNYENRPSWNTSYNDNKYLGNLEVHYYENKLKVVNELRLEDYLKGLAEISATEHYEKIKAIIVLARSYAKYYMTIGEKFPGAPFHLTDDAERSQKYLGYEFAQRNITGSKAVDDTRGQVVTYNGKVIKTPYFSSSDGRTRSAYEVWGWTNTPYLISVDDPGCAGRTMNGHGVGLSGCGSLYFANQGKNYKDIIKYYFKGVEISP